MMRCPMCDTPHLRTEWCSRCVREQHGAMIDAMPAPVPFTQKAIDAIRRELVVLLPIALAVYSVWPADVPVTSYKVWAPVVIGALLRQFVTTPAKEAAEKVDAAHAEGFDTGKNFGKSVLLHQLEALKPPADQ